MKHRQPAQDKSAKASRGKISWPASIQGLSNSSAITGLAFVFSTLIMFAGYWEDIVHFSQEIYGPRVHIGAIPHSTGHSSTGDFGSKSLMYEYQINNTAKPLRSDGAVTKLFDDAPITIAKVPCVSELNTGTSALGSVQNIPAHYYALNVAMQNVGDITAKDYQLMITFSGKDTDHTDPGVRVVYVASDALRIMYLYQQEIPKPSEAPACIRKYMERAERNNLKKDADADTESYSSNIDDLPRDVYRDMKLTRDVIILKGTLEAHFFQMASIIIKTDADLKDFAAIYHIECSNCRWFTRTESFGQHIARESSANDTSLPN